LQPHAGEDDRDVRLGISRSAAFKYAAGEAEVPHVVQYLIDMYERHGVPERKGLR
jgi:hypothetical protein